MADSNVVVEAFTGPCQVGEGPHWDVVTKKLYYVDIWGKSLHRYDPVTKQLTSCTLTESPFASFIIPVENTTDKFVVGCGTNFSLVTWDGTSPNATVKTLVTVDHGATSTRFNDGKADSSGRFWGGTMDIETGDEIKRDKGTFYHIDSSLVVHKKVFPVSISNGLDWNKNDTVMYYIDSFSEKIVQFDFNKKHGTISNQKDVFRLKDHNITGILDGLTTDADGNLWVAIYGGGCVIQVNPNDGKLLRVVKVPAKRTTSVAFGGENLDVLYVTSAKKGVLEKEVKELPHSGCVFQVKGLGVRGRKMNNFVLKN